MTREDLRAAITAPVALVCTLLGEAAGEPIEGQIAVASVVRNRAQHPRWWGKDVKGVCLRHTVKPTGQIVGNFTCWWEKNQNTARVYALAEALHLRQDATGPLSLVGQLQWIAAGVLDDVLLDNTGGADHYLTRALYQSTGCPSWARGKTPVAVVGAHVFLRLEL